MSRRPIAGILLVLLAALFWLLYRSQEPRPQEEEHSGSPAEAEAEGVAFAAEIAASPPSRQAVPSASPEEEASVCVHFLDLFTGEVLQPSGVVLLEEDGGSRVLEPEGDLFTLPSATPIVLAAAFLSHLPILAVLQDAPPGAPIPIHVYPSTKLEVSLEACAAEAFTAGATLQLSIEQPATAGTRGEHGQWRHSHRNLFHFKLREQWPELALRPDEWFPGAAAANWREQALWSLRPRGGATDEIVSAVFLTRPPQEQLVSSASLTWEEFPAGMSLSWRTSLPLRNLAPEPGQEPATATTAEGERYGRFSTAPGLTRLRLGWAAGASISGRLPRSAEAMPLLPPQVRIASIVHDEHSPPNGSFYNQAGGSVDPFGNFHFGDLAPGEHQVDAAWSVGEDVHLAAVRARLEAGEQRDLGLLDFLPGPPVHVHLQSRDLFGQALSPSAVFSDPSRSRSRISVSDRNAEPTGASTFLDLPVPYDRSLRLHGLREGFVFVHWDMSARPEDGELLPGVRFVRTDPRGARLRFPSEDTVTIGSVFQVGVVPVTLRFQFPDAVRGRRYDLRIVHAASGVEIPASQVVAERDERRRKDEVALELAPGAYCLLALDNGLSRPVAEELYHFAFTSFTVDEAHQHVDVPIRAGSVAHGTMSAAVRERIGDSAYFDVLAIGGVAEPSLLQMVAAVDATGGFTVRGLPPQSLLEERKSKTRWVMDDQGRIVQQ
jgi:hypothetical protein